LDIESGKYIGSVFVVKMPKESTVVYTPEGSGRTIVSPELFFRVKNKNPKLVNTIKQIIRGEK